MERFNMTPRSDYREKIEALGFDFHGDYWREEAYYRFTPAEIERLEEATREAYRMYCEAAEYIISEKPDFIKRLYYENKGFYISMYYNCNNVPNDYIKSTEYGKRKTTPRIP